MLNNCLYLYKCYISNLYKHQFQINFLFESFLFKEMKCLQRMIENGIKQGDLGHALINYY